MSTPVDPVTMKNNMKAAIGGIDISNGEIANDSVLEAICTAIADAVNQHTHTVTYVGAGSGSSTQTTEATPSGAP